MWHEPVINYLDLINKYYCNSLKCMIDADFPRYLCSYSVDNCLIYQEYYIDNFYVKVNEDNTSIYRLEGCILFDGITLQRSIWLDKLNKIAVLDKLKLMITLS